MVRYVVRRSIDGVVSLVLFTFVLFWLLEALVPGDYFTQFRLGMTAQEVDALREQFGVDDPIVVRWWRWVSGLAAGGLGLTTVGGRVSTQLGDAVPATVFVFSTGLLLAYLLGQWLGRVTGWRRSLGSDLLTLGGVTFTTLFPPFLGFLLTTFLALHLRQLRARFFEDVRRDLWFGSTFREADILAAMTWSLLLGVAVAGLAAILVWRRTRTRLAPAAAALVVGAVMVATWSLRGILPWALDVGFEALLPLTAFTLLAFGEFMLIMQAGMVGTLGEDYVATARAKGLPERVIRDRHAARNASLAVIARLAVSLPYLLTGLVIVEHAVGWRGIGSFLFAAIDAQDIPAVVSTLTVIGLMTVTVRVVLDVVLVLLDPRIAFGRAGA